MAQNPYTGHDSGSHTVNKVNSVFFDANPSTHSDEAKDTLTENVDVVSKCPNLRVRIESFTAPGERNVQSLSEDRAEAVADFYESHDVGESRISTIGEGQVDGVTTNKGGTRQYRRADSISVREDIDT